MQPLVSQDQVCQAANIVAEKYIYTDDLLEMERCMDSSNPVCWPMCPSPVCLENWEEALSSHPDRRFAAYIHSGFSSTGRG